VVVDELLGEVGGQATLQSRAMKKRALLMLAAAALLGCVAEARKTPQPIRVVQTVIPPAGPGSFAPHLSPARRGGVVLSWLEPVAGSKRTRVRVAELRAGRWQAPRTVVEGEELFANWADFPSITEDRNGTWFVHWLQKSGSGTYAYDVRMAISSDRGATWSASFLLNRDGKEAEHGFATVVPLPRGGVAVAWLDGRKMIAEGHGHDAGEMTLRYAEVVGDGTIGGEQELDGRVCECCATGMAMTSSGPLIVYRDRSPDEVRDVSFVVRTKSGWSRPRPLHADGWKIAGCPVNGPQTDAAGDGVVAAWFTAAGDEERVLASFSADGGLTLGAPVRVDDGKPAGRVDVVMLDAETALVVWVEQVGTAAEIRARTVGREGARGMAVVVAETSASRAAGFPRLARSGSTVWFAWTELNGDSKIVRLASLDLGSLR
jgi:hypothetical protein